MGSFLSSHLHPSFPMAQSCWERELDTQLLCPGSHTKFLFFAGLHAPAALGIRLQDSQDVSNTEQTLVSDAVFGRGHTWPRLMSGTGRSCMGKASLQLCFHPWAPGHSTEPSFQVRTSQKNLLASCQGFPRRHEPAGGWLSPLCTDDRNSDFQARGIFLELCSEEKKIILEWSAYCLAQPVGKATLAQRKN